MLFSGMGRCVALKRTDVSEEGITSISRVKGIIELRTTLGVTTNRSSAIQLKDTANVVSDSPILVTLMMEAIPKRRFLQQSHGVTPEKTVFCP
jgi:hypothetical protein